MATLKALKLREDEHRLMLENGIKALLASQAKVAEALERLTKQFALLSEQQGHMVALKEKPSVKAKPVRK